LLLAGDCECALERGFGFRGITLARFQRDFAGHAIDLGLSPCPCRWKNSRSNGRRQSRLHLPQAASCRASSMRPLTALRVVAVMSDADMFIAPALVAAYLAVGCLLLWWRGVRERR
jgi:hypothetical protein